MNYRNFINRLRILYPNFNIIQKETRNGFAKNVFETLLQCKNEYVLIIQHDWKFNFRIDFDSLIQKYFIDMDLNYLGFHSSIDYQNKKVIHTKSKEDIIPVHFWYDKNHLARKSYYLNEVFSNKRCKVKNFIEDTFGQYQLNDIKKNKDNFIKYKSFLLNSETNILINFDGRKFKEK